MLFFSVFAGAGLLTAVSTYRESVLSQNTTKLVVQLSFGSVFVLIGLGGIFWGLRVYARRKLQFRPLSARGPGQTATTFPELPRRSTTSQGRVRLSPEEVPGHQLLVLLFFSIFWNGIVATVWFLSSRDGNFPLFAKILLGLFAGIGILILYAFIKQLLQIVTVGATHVDLQAEPLAPGEKSVLMLVQAGDFEISELLIDLLAREIVVHGSGTDQTTYRETVYEELLTHRQRLRARNGQSVLQQEFAIPADAAPTFRSPSNQVQWSLRVKMVLPGRPDVMYYFPFRVAAKAPGADA